MNAEAGILWTDVSADAATGGRSTAPWRAGGVSMDTRALKAGDLFIALKGDPRAAVRFALPSVDET